MKKRERFNKRREKKENQGEWTLRGSLEKGRLKESEMKSQKPKGKQA